MVLQRYTQEYIVLASEGTELYLVERQKLMGIYFCLEINQRQVSVNTYRHIKQDPLQFIVASEVHFQHTM